jgi:FkbM family methyltransferase
MTNTENIARARALFADDLSLRVFDARVKCGADVRCEAFPEALEFTWLSDVSRQRLLRLMGEIRDPGRKKFIYGAGAGCRHVLEIASVRTLHASGWSGVIDNNVVGERYGLPVVSFAEFMTRHRDALVLNSIGQPAGAAVHRQCVEAGIDVVSLFEFDLSWRQYFDLPKEMGLVGDGEVFVHAGCYNGDTQKSFINWFGDAYAKMVTFEPDLRQFALSKEKLAGLRDTEIVQAGLSDRCGAALFDPDALGRSFISEAGSQEISVVALDEYMVGQRVTFIALDIEGGELLALKGAKGIIVEQKPKLAISAYHKPDDIWELPFLLKEYNPNYRLYLRHYHLLDMGETVLYAL